MAAFPNIDFTLEMAEFNRVIQEMEIDRLEPTFAFEQQRPGPEPFLLDDFDYVEQHLDEFQQLEKAIKYLSMKHKSVQTDDIPLPPAPVCEKKCCKCGKEMAEQDEATAETTDDHVLTDEGTNTEQTGYDPTSTCNLTSDGDTDCNPEDLDSDELGAASDFLEDQSFSQTDWDEEDETY